MAHRDDPRIPNPKGVIYPDMWKAGYADCLADMDAGLFDRPLPVEIDAARDYGFQVRKISSGQGLGWSGMWGVTYNGDGPIQDVGGACETKREAEALAVSRWREDIRYN